MAKGCGEQALTHKNKKINAFTQHFDRMAQLLQFRAGCILPPNTKKVFFLPKLC